MKTFFFIAAMAVVTYLVRMIPFTLFRREIRSRFLRDLLYYLPYAVLSAMTFPAILYSTGSIFSAAVGTVIALLLAYLDLPLIVVALAASAGAFLCGWIF